MTDTKKLFRYAGFLAIFTIIYNVLEGLVSVLFGVDDESLTLLGFGMDSFIEVLSGVGITHMIFRIRNNPDISRDRFEKTALIITGTSFYMLTAGLVILSIYNIITKHKPETTTWGIVISLVSILIMYFLFHEKKRVGVMLNSRAILADGECTKVCVYMSVILLISSVFYALFKIPYIDSIGALGLAYYSFNEGRECFKNAAKETYCSCNYWIQDSKSKTAD
jgi:divalent metal cation (Fe/Co/Zn/Cd) transporter